MAQERALDLIEVYPLADPPVARIQDYNKMKYQEAKDRKKEKAKQKKVEIKGIRLSLRIGRGDIDIRVKQAVKFLNENDKVKIELNLRGRERQHKDLAREIIEKFIQLVSEEVPVKREQDITLQGSKLSALIVKQS